MLGQPSIKYPLEYSRVDAIVAGADADAVDAADLADVVEVHCSKRKKGKRHGDGGHHYKAVPRLCHHSFLFLLCSHQPLST